MKVIFCLLFLVMNISATAQSLQKDEQITVNDIKRDFTTYVPAGLPDNAPLVISLHGGFASPEGQFRLADFRPLADLHHFVVICPASKHGWQDGKDAGKIDDVKFMSELMDYAIKTYHVDPNRIYVTGISKGGFMASRLACELSNRIAAVAVVAATLDIDEGYKPHNAMPIMFFHGTTDHIVPYKGGKLFGRSVYSHNEIINKWVKLDGCDIKPVVVKFPDKADDGTSIVKEVFTNPATGMQVVGYTINNGGHTWPGGWQYLPKILIGKTTQNLNACNEIWNFFRQYKLSNG